MIVVVIITVMAQACGRPLGFERPRHTSTSLAQPPASARRIGLSNSARSIGPPISALNSQAKRTILSLYACSQGCCAIVTIHEKIYDKDNNYYDYDVLSKAATTRNITTTAIYHATNATARAAATTTVATTDTQ